MIAKDKQLHLVAGALIGIVAVAACAFLFKSMAPEARLAVAVALAAAVGIGKELLDKKRPTTNTYDLKDAAFTAGGGLIGGIFASIAVPYVTG